MKNNKLTGLFVLDCDLISNVIKGVCYSQFKISADAIEGSMLFLWYVASIVGS